MQLAVATRPCHSCAADESRLRAGTDKAIRDRLAVFALLVFIADAHKLADQER